MMSSTNEDGTCSKVGATVWGVWGSITSTIFGSTPSTAIGVTKKKGGVFGVPLDVLMQSERERGLGKANSSVPAIFSLLVHLVRVNGGCGSEGLFRLCVPTDDQAFLATQIDEFKYDFECSDCNMAAALLKQWLRELPQPLIPSSLYTQCIAIGIRHREGQDLAAITQDCLTLLEDIPATARTVLRQLAGFSLEVASHSNQTRMDLRNLALIFCQMLLRNGEQEDENTALLNVSVETEFLQVLFSVIGKGS